MIRALIAAIALGALSALPAAAGCSAKPDPCRIAGGTYHIALPDGAPRGTVMFLHGAGSNGGNVMRNAGLVGAVTGRGYALIAPSALSRPGSRLRGVWNFYPGWPGRDDPAFLDAVHTDAAARFALGRDRSVLAGFSAGGFMVSYLACAAPDSFAAYAPVAGGFWRPHPARCAGPVNLLQTHGWRDRTVPLEGRLLGDGRFEQGDIFAGLEIWRRTNQCADMAPEETERSGDMLRRRWGDCAPGGTLEFVLFDGGHRIPRGWADMALDWFEALAPVTLPDGDPSPARPLRP